MIGCFYKSAVAIDVPILTFGIDTQRVSKEQRTSMGIGVFYCRCGLRRPGELRYGSGRGLGIAQTRLVETDVVDEQPCCYHEQYDNQNEDSESCR
jgi:hypothetical protein